jgi:TetR/AcrR family transcriptional regulator, transcriptional repressor for nem operon
MGRPRLFDLDAAVTSALDVFWKHGYAAATPAALLDAIGVGKGSFYNAFESKHAIFERTLLRYGDDRVAGLARSMSGAGPIRQRVKRYLERLAAPENTAVLRRGCFAANTAGELGGHDPVATKIVRDTFQRMERVLEASFTEAQERGELDRSLDAKAIAALLLAALIGITVIAKVDEPATLARRITQAFAALLLAVE